MDPTPPWRTREDEPEAPAGSDGEGPTSTISKKCPPGRNGGRPAPGIHLALACQTTIVCTALDVKRLTSQINGRKLQEVDRRGLGVSRPVSPCLRVGRRSCVESTATWPAGVHLPLRGMRLGRPLPRESESEAEVSGSILGPKKLGPGTSRPSERSLTHR